MADAQQAGKAAAATVTAASKQDTAKMADAQQAAKTAASAVRDPGYIVVAAKTAIAAARSNERAEKSERHKELLSMMKFEPAPVEHHPVQAAPPGGWTPRSYRLR